MPILFIKCYLDIKNFQDKGSLSYQLYTMDLLELRFAICYNE